MGFDMMVVGVPIWTVALVAENLTFLGVADEAREGQMTPFAVEELRSVLRRHSYGDVYVAHGQHWYGAAFRISDLSLLSLHDSHELARQLWAKAVEGADLPRWPLVQL